MSRQPDSFSDYSFSEYTQPAPQKMIDYTDPHFYEKESASRLSASPVQMKSPYGQYPPAPDVYETMPMREYTGPANLDGYIQDAGAEQGEAGQNGQEGATGEAKKGLASLGSAGVVLGFALKFGLASISALVSVVIYAQLFGWRFGVGLVILLFIHEMGHAVVMKIKGIPISGMIFIPMLGAAVIMRRMPVNARDDAEVGIAGPMAGALAGLICLFIALSSHGLPGIWAPLAYFSCFLNLFNLIPIFPLDGGRVLGAIDRRIWLIGLALMIAIQVWQWVTGNFSAWLLIFIAMGITNFFVQRQTASSPEKQAFYSVPRGERIAIGVAYFGLVIVLVLGMTVAHGLMIAPQ
jgi:Zn-dependent protease